MTRPKVHISRFTPSLMPPETLEAIFVQRQQIAVDTLERIRESALQGNMHYQLFIGPRGCGKTHFVSLIYHRLKAQEDLGNALRIAWLNEDKTSTSVLDLNRRIYEALGDSYPEDFPKRLLETLYDRRPSEAASVVQELLRERLGEKTVLVIVENLDALFENLGRQGQHDWRAHLQESGQIAVLATAQQLFPGVSDRNLPFYGFFQNTFLKPLTVQNGLLLLKNIATQQQDEDLAQFLDTPAGRNRVRTLHHLSGGNHRVYVIFSEFINRKNLDELVAPFEKTLDELIPYYQERLRWITPQQRMIVEHLCACDRAVPVREIARALFATSQTISKQLRELKQKRYVRSAQRGRESLYELAEPLMRLAMELKENRGGPIRLIVDFLRVWYDREDLENRLNALAPQETLERLHVEAAIEQYTKGEESLKVRALLSDIEALAAEGPEQEILDALEELEAAAGQENREQVAQQILERLEDRYPEIRLGTQLSPEGIPPELALLSNENTYEFPSLGWLHYLYIGRTGLKGRTLETDDAESADKKGEAVAGDYRFGSIVKTVPAVGPELPKTLDASSVHQQFVQRLRCSVAYKIATKQRILASLPRRPKSQVETMTRQLAEFEEKLSRLPLRFLPALRAAERTSARDWCKTPWDGAVSTQATAWLEAHREDELEDLLHAIDNPSGYEFSEEEQLDFRLGAAAWFAAESRHEDLRQWVEKTHDFIQSSTEIETRTSLLKTFATELRPWDFRETALELATEATVLAPKDAEAHTLMGLIQQDLGQHQLALDAHSKAIAIDPENFWNRTGRIAALLGMERSQEALREAKEIVALDSNLSAAWQVKALVLATMSNFEEARKDILRAASLDETNPFPWWIRGVLEHRLGRDSEAITSFERAIELKGPQTPWIAYLALSHYRLGHLENAQKSVARALEIDPENALAKFTEVAVCLANGQWEAGWVRAREALTKHPPGDPSLPEAQQFDQHLVLAIFSSSRSKEVWWPRIDALCEIYDDLKALSYLGDGLVRSLGELHHQLTEEKVLLDWEASWQKAGDRYPDLSFALRVFSAGIQYIETQKSSVLLDLPVEQRAILEQLFDIEVRHNE